MIEQRYSRASDGTFIYRKIELPTFGQVAVVENERLSWLLEYSTSNPTGAYPNKMWKRKDFEFGGWFVCEYVDHPTDPNLLRTYVRRAATPEVMGLVAEGVLWFIQGTGEDVMKNKEALECST